MMAAKVPLQAVASSNLRLETKPTFFVGRRVEGVDRQLNSVSISSSGLAFGAGRRVGGVLWSLEEFILVGLSKGQLCARNASWGFGKCQEWRGGRSRSSTSIARERIRAVDGESSSRETGNDTGSENFSRGGGPSKRFFIDQNYEYDNRGDFNLDESASDIESGSYGKYRIRSRNGVLEEHYDVRRGYAERQLPSAGSRQQAQLDGGGRREAIGRGTRDPTARRGEEGYRAGELNYREQLLENDDPSWRKPSYIRYARERKSERILPAPADDAVLGQELPGDDGQHVVESRESFPPEEDLQGSNLDMIAKEDRLESPNRTKGDPYTTNSSLDATSLFPVTQESSSVLPKGPKNDENIHNQSGSRPNELGGFEETGSQPGSDFDNRDGFQSTGKGDKIAGDKEQDQFPSKRGRNERYRVSGKEAELELSARGALYAKQVISLVTARSLGYVTKLWVDMDSLTVVAVEMRPSLLFGSFESFLLESVSKVGDVILVRENDIVLEEQDLFNCSDLVDNDLFTEEGVYLGKVRDYRFSLDNGAVLSLEIDTLGIPLIPSKLVNTYSLTVDEVIETEDDSLLVRKGAEKRLRKMSKGLWSRVMQSSIGRQPRRREQRKRGAPLKSSRTPFGKAAEIDDFGQESDPTGGYVNRNDYTRGYTSREQAKRGDMYSNDKRGTINDALLADEMEKDTLQDMAESRAFSARRKDFAPEESTDYQSEDSFPRRSFSSGRKDRALEDSDVYQIPASTTKERQVRESQEILENEQSQGQGISVPERRLDSWDNPIPYRRSRRTNQDDE